MNDRKINSLLGLGQFSQKVPTGLSAFSVDSVPVESGQHWIVDRANLLVAIEGIGAFIPANGSFIGIYLCPPTTGAMESGNSTGVGQALTIIKARPIVIAEFNLGFDAPYSSEGDGVNQGGVNAGFYAMCKSIEPFIVPAGWFIRGAVNLSGNSGGFTANTQAFLNILYAREATC